MKRRDLLKAAPLAFVGCAPVLSQASESPLRSLYFEWQALKVEYNNLYDGFTEDEDDAMFKRILDMEQRAADYEAKTLEDMAFKIIFADDNGQMRNGPHQMDLVSRAYQSVGIAERI